MLLLIDSSKNEQITLSLYVNKNWVHGSFGTSVSLLENINQFFKKNNLKISDLKGLAVLVGEGRFTSTRVAVTVANTLAYVLQVPVVPVNKIDWEKIPGQINDTPVGQYAVAKYSGEPNIGKKQKT